MLSRYDSKIEWIQKQCETHDRFLKELVQGHYASPQSYLPGELSFNIARRWNSWYPSYFNVQGGCYILIPGDLDSENENNKRDPRIGVVAIDPGFKFIEILRVHYQIEPQDISTVIVSHFHPDHMAGLLEYATIMYASKKSCNVYLNETTFATFKSLQNTYIAVNELHDGQIQEIMDYVTRDQQHIRVTVKAVGVHHNELGNQHCSLGLILETTRTKNEDIASYLNRYQIGILGDTDGNEEYISDYVDAFRKMDILVLHLGTFSNKQFGRGGKHLYIEGIKRVLERMGTEARDKKKIVILSEFGLELADGDLLYRKLQPFIESHFWRLPLIFTDLYLKKEDGNKVSHFFARATLAILERIYDSFESTKKISQQVLTKKEKEELLLTFGFQALAFDNENFRKIVRDLEGELKSILEKEKELHVSDGLLLERYLSLLDRKIRDNQDLEPLRKFFKVLVQKASFTQISLSFDHLVKSCEFLIEEIGRNLESIGNVLYYIDKDIDKNKLDYISKYAKSRGINEEKYRWALGKDDVITDLNLFWTACLIGVFVLYEALQAASKAVTETKPSQPPTDKECPLLQIGDFFREHAESWANLLVGDIGCTFGIDPFEMSDSKERREGIWLKSTQGEWILPYNAEGFYDDGNKRISYRTPEAEQES